MLKAAFSDLPQHMRLLALWFEAKAPKSGIQSPWFKDPIHDLLWYGPLKGTLRSDSQLRAISLQVSNLSIVSPGRCCHGPRHLS